MAHLITKQQEASKCMLRPIKEQSSDLISKDFSVTKECSVTKILERS